MTAVLGSMFVPGLVISMLPVLAAKLKFVFMFKLLKYQNAF